MFDAEGYRYTEVWAILRRQFLEKGVVDNRASCGIGVFGIVGRFCVETCACGH